jgi:membrane fusion protein (multidrug efflux system)
LNKRKDIRIGALLAQATLFAVFAGCSHDENATNVQPPPPQVLVAKVTRQTVPISEDYQGTVGSIQAVEVRARVTGILESAPFKEGTLVRQGQLIFTLQKDKYQADVDAAQASLQKAKAELYEAQDTVPVQQAEANLAQKQAILERANITVARLTPLAADKAVPYKDLQNAIQQQAAALADVNVAKAQLTNAKVNQTGGIEQAKAAVLSAQSTLDNAKLNLSYCTVAAPVTGLIGFLKYDVGNVVGGTGDEVLDTITTVDPIKVLFAVDENTYLALAGAKGSSSTQGLRDQPVQLVLANNNVYPYPGKLYTVNPTLDAKTGTTTVEARFPNPKALLRPGQFARVRLTIQNRPNALLVPQTAIVQTQGVNSAFVIDANNVADIRTVSIGPAYKDSYVVVSGLSAGDRVVVQGTQKVRPGLKVVPKNS